MEGRHATPELRALAALDDLRDALGAFFAARREPVEPAALLTITDAARRLGVSRSTATRWADDGRLRTIGVRNGRRVPRSEVERLAS
ncbi:MAG: helix-turn-helix domain-containing protein [Chloroflexi bacterium]|nr:helix-turn-helix domain-containing protein [Chloroflexota bacterium]